MKRILGVVGSPRKNGNTHTLVSRILEGAEQEGARVEGIFLNDLHIMECDGCHACWKTGKCSKDDDMIPVYPKIMESDVIILGTPVYWYGPTALMKGFIDRLVYFNCPENRPKIRGKSAVLVVPFEEENPEAAELLLAMFEKSLSYLEMTLAAQILVPGVTLRGEILNKKSVLDRAYEIGRGLASPAIS